MTLTYARYRRPFVLDALACEVIVRVAVTGIRSELRVDGVVVARDSTPAAGAEAARNHRLVAALPDGRQFEVEAGYINWVTVGIAVRREGALVHESHPGRAIAFPASLARIAADPHTDLGRIKANRVPIAVDIALGLLFFVLARLTDLTTAALLGAAVGLALVVVQRFVRVDLLGGLALFGVVMLLLSAGLALAFEDEMAIKMRSTIIGSIGAVLFLSDGLLGGRRLGAGMARYLPYTDIDPGRLAMGMGAVGLVMAALNYLVARFASTQAWLFYTTFGDVAVTIAMVQLVFRYARSGAGAIARPGRAVTGF